VLDHSQEIYDPSWVEQEDYAKYKYVINLPGQTAGSYSRNLNHLWSLGAAVLLWDTAIVEWYYPALVTGETHLSVNRSTAIEIIDRIEQDNSALKRLVEGALTVHAESTCAKCIAHHWNDVFHAIRQRVSYDLVLDSRQKVLKIAEAVPGACDAYSQVQVNFQAKNAAKAVLRDVGLCEWLRAG